MKQIKKPKRKQDKEKRNDQEKKTETNVEKNRNETNRVWNGSNNSSRTNRSEFEIQQRDGTLFNDKDDSRSIENRGSKIGIIRTSRGSVDRQIRKENKRNDRNVEIVVTLQDLKDSISKEILLSLLKNTYKPEKEISIKYKKKIRTKTKDPKRLKPTKLKRIHNKKRKLADIYVPLYENWCKTRNENEITSNVIFGCYLYYYYENYKENDPEFAGKSSPKNALFHINKFIHDLEITNRDLLDFVETIFPLWAKAQKNENINFPDSRPSFKTFFVKRKIWSQRFSLYKRWKDL